MSQEHKNEPEIGPYMDESPDYPGELDMPTHDKPVEVIPTPRTDALKIPSEAMLLLGQKGVPEQIVKAILTLGDHAREMERTAKRWQQIANQRAVEVADLRHHADIASRSAERAIDDSVPLGYPGLFKAPASSARPSNADLEDSIKFWRHYAILSEPAQEDIADEKEAMLERMQAWADAESATMPAIEDESYPYRLRDGDVVDTRGRRITVPGNLGIVQLLNTIVELRGELRAARSATRRINYAASAEYQLAERVLKGWEAAPVDDDSGFAEKVILARAYMAMVEATDRGSA